MKLIKLILIVATCLKSQYIFSQDWGAKFKSVRDGVSSATPIGPRGALEGSALRHPFASPVKAFALDSSVSAVSIGLGNDKKSPDSVADASTVIDTSSRSELPAAAAVGMQAYADGREFLSRLDGIDKTILESCKEAKRNFIYGDKDEDGATVDFISAKYFHEPWYTGLRGLMETARPISEERKKRLILKSQRMEAYASEMEAILDQIEEEGKR